MIARNLLRRRMRTALTLLGIAIGVTAIVTLSGMAEGFLANFASVMTGSGADLTVAAKQEAGAAIQVAVNAIDESWGGTLRGMPEVRSVAAMLYTVVPTADVPYFVVFGHETDGFAVRRFKVIEGEGLGGRGAAKGRPLLLGKTAAQNLKKRVGDSLTIYGATYRIVGLYETGGVMEDGGAVVTLAEAQRLADQPHQVSMFLVQLKRPEQLALTRERIQRRLPDLQVVSSSDSSGLQGWLKLVRPFAWATALIAALLGGVGMMNAMLMSVIERTREIGVLRALGWKRRQLLAMILGESLSLSLLGGATGTALGVLLIHLLGKLAAFSGFLQGVLKPSLLLEALSATLVLGTVGGLYPAWRASRMTPIEALRYEGGSDSAAGSPAAGSMAARNLLRQRSRTALTMVGIMVGVIAVTALSSLGQGFVVEFGKVLSSAELTASQANTSDMSLSSIDERVGNQIEATPGVEYAAGGTMAFASLPEVPLFMVTGYRSDSSGLNRFRYRSGGPPVARGQMALGWKAAQALRKGLGDGVRALGGQFHVVGIYEAGAEYFDSGAVVTLRELQRLLGKPRKVMFYEIKLVRPEETDAVLARLRQQFPNLAITRSSEFIEKLPDMQTTNGFTSAIVTMTLVVGSVVVMNTMVMSVIERTRELGVLRALGWRRRQVLGLIVNESLLLTVASGLLGLLVTWLLLRGMALFPGLDAIARMLVLTPIILLRVGLLCIGLGVLGGIYPAWRATLLLPVEALRYE